MSRKLSGFRAWLIQRVSAVYLAAYTVYLLGFFTASPPQNYAAFVSWLAQPLVSVSMALCFLALLVHAWIGIRDVVIDYIHPLAARLLVLILVALLLISCGFWFLQTLLQVSLWR